MHKRRMRIGSTLLAVLFIFGPMTPITSPDNANQSKGIEGKSKDKILPHYIVCMERSEKKETILCEGTGGFYGWCRWSLEQGEEG